MEAVIFLIIGVAIAYFVGKWGETRRIGFGWAFFWALISPLLGAIIVSFSSKLSREEITELVRTEKV